MSDEKRDEGEDAARRNGRVHLRRVLDGFDFLQEGVIRDLVFSDHGLTIQIVFDRSARSVPSTNDPQAVTMSLRGVRSAHFENALPPQMWSNTHPLDWGADEIAGVEVNGADGLAMGHAMRSELHHVALLWEGSMRRIDIVCESIDVSPQHAGLGTARWGEFTLDDSSE